MDFDQDLIEAQKFQSTNPVESKVRCFYNPAKPLQVLLSVDYSVQTWILVGISSFILFIMLIIGTNYIFHKGSFLKDINHRNFSLQCGIWIGTIFPSLFLLLLLVPITNKFVLLVLSLCFITIGWTPLLISSIIKFKRKSFLMACFMTFLFFILPIIIFGLTVIDISIKIPEMKILLIILVIIILIGYIFWITEIWNKLHKLFTRLFYNISKEEKKSPIKIAKRNENPIMNDNAFPIYEEAIAKQ
ncbi:hypothetical protein F8M41_007416 [Gigaspora margarita]|uniref:Uncharacterized protein n=1 Tax=Gigaspora margarita TaxID=4874 RepID=A0A8H4A4D5_GIGMA|nr:hypothetical protein F8M41_007416 [Gigaspora margarita]